MRRLLFLIAACVLGGVLGAATLEGASQALDPSSGRDAGRLVVAGSVFDGIPGSGIAAAEAAAILGGDVVIKVNEDRTQITVDVYINDRELMRLRPEPIKTIVIDVHNRVVNTKEAPYMPAPNSVKATPPAKAKLTTQPEKFPAGTWNVTAVKETTAANAKFGPNVISTDAVGKVTVYADGKSLGTYSDAGYAIHSNTNDFDKSKSWGCLIIRQEDNKALAKILRDDRASAAKDVEREGRAVQLVNLR